MQFIQRILSEVGIYWRTEMDGGCGLNVYIFADSQLNYQFDVRLPYREPSGIFDGAAESVWDVRTWHNIATGTVTTWDYNNRIATTPMDASVSVRSDAATSGEHYCYAAPYRDVDDDASPEPETESGAFYARLHHERELNMSSYGSGAFGLWVRMFSGFVPVFNSDFRKWQNKHGTGGDYIVFSDLLWIPPLDKDRLVIL